MEKLNDKSLQYIQKLRTENPFVSRSLGVTTQRPVTRHGNFLKQRRIYPVAKQTQLPQI